MAEIVNTNRRKRIKATLYRLKRANHRLRDRLHRYRAWMGGLAAAAIALTLATVYLAADDLRANAVLLGEGQAGVVGLDTAEVTPLVGPPAPEADFPELDAGRSGQEVGSGEASYYGPGLAGRRTASGEPFDPSALTAAHRSLPMGSKLRVTNVRNGRSVVVRVNDRGPFAPRRVIDLSESAARSIGMVSAGTAMVRMELLD